MTIERTMEKGSLVLALDGELTANTADKLNSAIEAALNETNSLILDFSDMEYVASAGLRILLKAKKASNAKKGKFFIRNVSSDVMNVFEITGFSEILDFL